MKVQVVTFGLDGLTDADYRAACEHEWAAVIADTPGLLSKTWVADPAANSYGGIYVWADQAAIEAFATSAFFLGFSSDPRIRDLRAHTFEVMEEPTRRTNGLGIVVA